MTNTLDKVVKPISPKDVSSQKTKLIPSVVFEVFNELIALNFSGKSSVVRQDVAADRIVILYNKRNEFHTIDKRYVYDNNWLDIEDSYRDAGWKVYYDKPGYNETYPATFEFTK